MIPGWKRDRALDLFNRLDVTHSSSITQRDLQVLAEHTIVGTHVASGSVKAKAIRVSYEYLWETIFAPMDTNGDREVNIEEFKTGINELPDDDEVFIPAITHIAAAIFNAYDRDENGSLSAEEIVSWLGEHGITREDALAHVREMDTNRNNTISYNELVSAIRDYYLNPESNMDGNWMFGPERSVVLHEPAEQATALDANPSLPSPSMSPNR